VLFSVIFSYILIKITSKIVQKLLLLAIFSPYIIKFDLKLLYIFVYLLYTVYHLNNVIFCNIIVQFIDTIIRFKFLNLSSSHTQIFKITNYKLED